MVRGTALRHRERLQALRRELQERGLPGSSGRRGSRDRGQGAGHVMTAGTGLTALPAWKALAAHYQRVRNLHLRELFASDPGRGERLTAEAGASTSTTRRIASRTRRSRSSSGWQRSVGCARESMPCSAARKSTSPRIGPSCTSRYARREGPRSWWTARTSCPGCTRSSTDGGLHRSRPERRLEGTHRAAHQKRRQTSASAARTWGRPWPTKPCGTTAIAR